MKQAELKSLLLKARSKGCSFKTAKSDGLDYKGIPASLKLAQNDLGRVLECKAAFITASQKTDVPWQFIAALASRESRVGNVLDSKGWGDHGNAFGLLQVDRRYHDIKGSHDPYSTEHLVQGIEILKGYHQQVIAKHPNWKGWQQLRGAVAAYNVGVSNIQTVRGTDVGTTGNDYSQDVIARFWFYHSLT